MPIQHKTGNRHIARSAALMASNKRQHTIDKFFTRTRQKGSDGPLEVITTVTETIESVKSEAKLQIPLPFARKVLEIPPSNMPILKIGII